MAYAQDLLEQAKHLALRETGRPRRASLRRSVSAAYYALFHLLVADAVKRFCPPFPKELQFRWHRSFVHNDMLQACKGFANANPPENLTALLSVPLPPEIVAVATAFVSLQQERHYADYDLGRTISRQDALNQIEKADNAFRAWKNIRQTQSADVFLSALLLGKHWSR
jgi:hypothetical protein